MLLALVVVVCFGSVFFTLLHDGEKTTSSDVLISLGLGGSLLSAVDVAARFLHLPLNPTVLAASVLLGGTAIAGLYKRKICWGFSSAERPLRRMRSRWVSLVLVLLFVAPVSLAGIEMGRGPWPELFFNVDTGYYLTHVHELLRDDAYPPASLFTNGEHFAYHRGTQNIVAVLARLSEWPAHRMFFLLVAPFLPLRFASVSWRIADRAALRGVPHALAMLIMLFFVEYPAGRMVDHFAGSLDGGVGQALQSALGTLASSQVFRGGFPLPSRNEGMFLTVATVYVLFFARNRQSVWIAALSVGLLPLFKSAYFIPAGVLLGLWAVAMVVRTRSIRFVLIPAIAFFLGLALTLICTNPTASLVVSGRALAQHWDRSLMFAVQMVLSGAVTILVVRTGCGRPYATASLLVPWGASLIALCLSCFLMVVYVDYRQIPEDNWDAAQILYPTTIFMSVALILLLMRAWTESRAAQRARLTRTFVGLTAIPILYQIATCGFIVLRPERWHEYADNRPIGEALAKIPVEGSVIATNDLRYPANDFKRDLRQMQISAIFGHQAYASNVRYEPFPGAMQRVDNQRLLRTGVWGAGHEAVADEGNWTHVLIHKLAPAISEIPGRTVFESPRYRVYELPGRRRR